MNTSLIYTNTVNHQKLNLLIQEVETKKNLNILNKFNLDQMNLKYCTGCWSCWWKTPGKCAIKDGIDSLYKAIMKSDLIIFAAPLLMGTIPAKLKQFTERIIPLLHPYTTLVDKEIHHKKRYKKYPLLGILLGDEKNTTEEDRNLNRNYFERLVRNFHSQLSFFDYAEYTNSEAKYEVLVS